GATPAQVEELERRLASSAELRPFADLPGAGAAGGLGAALAALGAPLMPGADYLLEALGFRERVREAAFVVTGEGLVDGTTMEGKAPGAVLRVCREEGVRCVVFGGRVALALEGAEMRDLSGEPARAREDLALLGEELARSL
ncbi:MAG: glycerate kinase, partial [Gaiellaceae bacterium]